MWWWLRRRVSSSIASLRAKSACPCGGPLPREGAFSALNRWEHCAGNSRWQRDRKRGPLTVRSAWARSLVDQRIKLLLWRNLASLPRTRLQSLLPVAPTCAMIRALGLSANHHSWVVAVPLRPYGGVGRNIPATGSTINVPQVHLAWPKRPRPARAKAWRLAENAEPPGAPVPSQARSCLSWTV